jgi:hypothetical protein
MRLLVCAILFATWAVLAGAQPSSYQPAVPAPSNVSAYGGWPSEGGGTTIAGSALSGMASVVSAAGDYNLSTSAAAVNMTQAQKQEIVNRQEATKAYFDMRATNRNAREAERAPRPTMEQIARFAQSGVPKALDAYQMDPVTGKLGWPGFLQSDFFESTRAELDQLLAKRATQGGLAYSDQTKVRETVNEMYAQLKSQIREVPPQDYAASRQFLQRLIYAACKTELD